MKPEHDADADGVAPHAYVPSRDATASDPSTPNGHQRGHHAHNGRQSQVEVPPRLLLTVEEAAQILSMGKTKAWDLVWTEELGSVRKGHWVRIPYSSCVEWVKNNTTPQAMTRTREPRPKKNKEQKDD